MKTKFTTTALVLAAALVASTSFAGVTREQVKAELAQAIRSGDITAGGEINLKLNEVYPGTIRPVKQLQDCFASK